MLSIEAVKGELEDPDAKAWCSANGGFFEANDVSRLADVSNWVNSARQFRPDAKTHFLSRADPILIAHALAKGYVLVTHEVSAPGAKRKVPIPDVCAAFSVQFKNTFEVLDELRARFVLEVRAEG